MSRRSLPPILLLLALLLAGAARAGAVDLSRRWVSARSAHFTIHYPEECAEVAARAAAIAEQVHERLVPRIGWRPRGRTQLVLSDDDDRAGGYATVFPDNRILVSLAPALGEPGFGTTVHDDWLRLVITHEYAHVLQLDMVAGLPRLLRGLLGRVYFPNALAPLWLVEGLATFEETASTSGGRGRSPGAEMVLRMAALAGEVPGLDRMAVFPDPWPAGQVPYLFGASFHDHLVERFGRERVAGIGAAYSGRSLPFLVESTGRSVLGSGYRDLWRDWAEALGRRARAVALEVGARNPAPSRQITDGGRHNLAPAWSPDGTRIAWLRSDGDEVPGLWVMDADGSGKRRLVDLPFSIATSAATLAWSPDATRIYYTKPGVVRGAAVVNDLWAWDLAGGREVRLTSGLRARDPHPSPDGRRLVFVLAGQGRTALATLDLAGALPAGPRDVRHLVGPGPEQYAVPRWSPDGSRIAAGVWRPGGEQDVVLLDAGGDLAGEVARDRALDGSPAWSADGSLLFFSSDRTGIFNVLALETATGRLLQVTDVVGGAFSPSPSPDGRSLAFVSYSARGYDIHVADLRPRSWPAAPAFVDRFPPAEPPPAAVPAVSRPYSASQTLPPSFWVPQFAAGWDGRTFLGLATGGEDVLGRHRYLFTGLASSESPRLMYAAEYLYRGLRPSLRLRASDADRVHPGLLEADGRKRSYAERVRSAGVDAVLELPGLESSHRLSLGYRHRRLTALSATPPGDDDGDGLPARGRLGSARLAWSYADARGPAAATGPERGRLVEVGVEAFGPATGSDRTFARASADWVGFLRMPWRHHVLRARVFAGTASADAPLQGAYRLGGHGGGGPFPLDAEALPLRGYPANAVRGRSALLVGLEYRFPLAALDRGGVSLPLFLRRAHGALYAEAGGAGDGGLPPGELRRGVGAELRLDLFASYAVPATAFAGVAFGLDKEGGVYPTIGFRVPLDLLTGGAGPGRR